MSFNKLHFTLLQGNPCKNALPLPYWEKKNYQLYFIQDKNIAPLEDTINDVL